MWPYHPDLLATPVPRYTSYPTAAEFDGSVGEKDQLAALAQVSGAVSLYLHIPFCEQICWYCGCNTAAANKRSRLEAYLDALHHDIALTGAKLGKRGEIRRIAFGGGSPNALQPTDFVRLADALTVHMPLESPEWSVEIDPRHLTSAWVSVLAVIGVTKASLGVQTFSPRLQQAIGRVQPDEEIERATALLRRGGITSLNFDLMYGLPGQTMEDLEATLARTVELGADRVALFGYAHVPHMIPRQKRIDASALPGQDERFAMAAFGHEFFTRAGYVPVGFDHFARPGDPMAEAVRNGTLRRNFQGFTEDRADFLVGLGATAISCFPDVIVQNEKNAGTYRSILSEDRLPGALGVRRDAQDQARAAIIEALLCQGRAKVGGELLADLREGLRPFIERGLAAIDGEWLSITPAGLPYARTIAARFDVYRQDSLRRFSSAV
ncbi:oxygen-independent coproporphyrinogen III oxidase [Novosphingobium sp. TH158]|uniref:oxygen-independent coproporphyrinogen III oxidase n=1 Tax=Novosphingobium sp. TH158 TaxID=2067455 RepID=UPI000C7B77DD|nr:oxygen-independent coproporphyrinogen III oxidase [Novosphingobium sp. TH158]PLK24362.1 oxygen-independent coproporphyrinogen III oxidase [Novosphingobium sp. TH158]